MGISLNPLKLFSRGKHVRLVKPGDDYYPDDPEDNTDGVGDPFTHYRALPYVVNSGDDFNWEINPHILKNVRLIERVRRSTSAAFPVPKFEVRKPVRLGSASMVTLGEYSDMPSREDIEQHWVPQFGGGEYTIYAKSAAYTGPVMGYKFQGAPRWQTPDEAIREARKAEKPKTLDERLNDRALDLLDKRPDIADAVATERLYKSLGLERPKEKEKGGKDKEPADPFDELDRWMVRIERLGLMNRGVGDGEKKTSVVDLLMELAHTGQLEPLVGRLTSMIPQGQTLPQAQIGGAPQQPALGPGQPQPIPVSQPRQQVVQQGPQPAQPAPQGAQQETKVDNAQFAQQVLTKLKARLKGTDLMGILKTADWAWLQGALSLRPTEFVQKLYADLQAQKPGLGELEVILHEFTVDEIRVLLAEVKKLLDNPLVKVLASATMDSKAIDTVSAVATVLVTTAGTTWLTSVKQGIDLTYKAVEERMNKAGVADVVEESEGKGEDGSDGISEVVEDGPSAKDDNNGAVVVVQPPDRPKKPSPIAAVVDIPTTLTDDGEENTSDGPTI